MTELLVVHGLRLRGRADPGRLLDLYGPVGLTAPDTVAALEALVDERRAREREGRWALTNPVGLRHHRSVLDAEVAAADAEPTVRAAIAAFAEPNARLLALVTAVQADGRAVDSVIGEVDELVATVEADVAAPVAERLPRFGVHGPRLRRAATRARTGEPEWLAGALVDSVHTCWFELHEDLLTTIGATRRETMPPA